MTLNILAPAAVLVSWSLVILVWMFATRLKGFSNLGIDLAKGDPGARYSDVEEKMPASINWKAHNFTHLMEQPTIFYALVFVIALSGAGEATPAYWAWAYTIIRILHSLWQSLVNTIPVRFMLFAASNVCLFALAYFALRLTL